MSPKVQRICIWCGPALMGVFFLGLIAAHWFPPPSPGDSAEETARLYQQHTDGIRICALLAAFAGALLAPPVAVISSQIRRIEGPFPTLSNIQFGLGGILGGAFFIIPAFFWEAAAFDPGRDPEITEALHSAGWLILVSAIFPALLQYASIAIATFTDRREDPVFPRWFGYFNVWVAGLLIPSTLVLFFHHGPFAWNGIFTFWLAATVFTIWLVGTLVVCLRAIAQQEAEEASQEEPEEERLPADRERGRPVPLAGA